jgi:hypothetical protein
VSVILKTTQRLWERFLLYVGRENMAAILLAESAITTPGLFIVFGVAVLLAVDRWFATLGAF